jgi:hypothetical protein
MKANDRENPRLLAFTITIQAIIYTKDQAQVAVEVQT